MNISKRMKQEILIFPEEVTLNLGKEYPLVPPCKIERGRGLSWVILHFEVVAVRDHKSIGEEFLFRDHELHYKVRFKDLKRGQVYSTQFIMEDQ